MGPYTWHASASVAGAGGGGTVLENRGPGGNWEEACQKQGQGHRAVRNEPPIYKKGVCNEVRSRCAGCRKRS